MPHPIYPRRARPSRSWALAATFAGCLLASASHAAPPVAEVRDVPTVIHGSTVPDPYRWLEDVKSPAAQAWFKGQGDEARRVLDRIDVRAGIAARLAEWSQAQGDAVTGVMQMPGGRLYYLKRVAGERQFKLVMRPGLSGPEQVLFDPEIEAQKTGVPHAINHFKPSWDGRYVAYGVSAGGSENATLYVLDTTTMKTVGEPVPRVTEALVSWLPDSRTVSFNRFRELPAGAAATEAYKDSELMLMPVGQAPRAIFGPQLTKDLGLDRLDVGGLHVVPGSRWAVVRTTDTTVPEGKLFVAPLSSLAGPALPKWRRIGDESDRVVKIALKGEHLYVLTQKEASRRRIVRLALAQGTLAKNAQAVTEQPQDGVIQTFTLTPSGLVAEVQHGTQLKLVRHVHGDLKGKLIPLPAAGAAYPASVPAHDTEELLYSFAGWTEPSRLYQLKKGDRSEPVELARRAVPQGLPALEVTEVLVPSHDGVKVPMTVLHAKGLKKDGKAPVLVHGYASYGLNWNAGFRLYDMSWIERGGVIAITNPRGSGVYGDDWHRAGFKTSKANTWKDGIASAQWLVDQGYGSPKTLGIMGTSAGGIFVGRATTEAPQLFAAAIYNVGMLDTIRSEESANGATNISEFGTIHKPEEFKGLLAMSTYHAIRDGVRYPAVLLVHGMNDPRVDVWESGKVAARLQAAQAQLPDARPTLLRLDMQAGHGVGSTLNQRIEQEADIQAFLLWQMGLAQLKD